MNITFQLIMYKISKCDLFSYFSLRSEVNFPSNIPMGGEGGGRGGEVGGRTRKNFDRAARVIFWGLKFDKLLFFRLLKMRVIFWGLKQQVLFFG